MEAAGRELGRIGRDTGRLLLRHWPALLTLGLLGAAWRAGAVWLAVIVSDHSGIAAQWLLALAPVGYLLAVVGMLRVGRGTLPRLRAARDATAPRATAEGRPTRLLDIAASVLIPFLGAYIAYGLFDQDLARFTNVAAFDEFNQFDLTREVDYDFMGRLGLYAWPIALAIVVGAWVVRWALGIAEARTGWVALGLLGALAEVYYTGQLAVQSAMLRTGGLDWLATRRASSSPAQLWDWVTAHASWLAHGLAVVGGLAGALLGSAEAVLLVPIAWLVVATIVLGHNVFPEHEAAEGQRARWLRSPVVRSFADDILERFGPFADAMRVLGAIGLIPMLGLCLIMLLIVRIPTLVSYAVRAVVGPVKTDTWLAFSPIEGAAGLALSLTVLAPLLAATVAWILDRAATTAAVQGGEVQGAEVQGSARNSTYSG